VDPQGQSSSSLTAQCQLHVGQPFTAVCQRCGTYMCAVCSEGGRHVQCAACRERAGIGAFPFRRDAYTLGALFEFAWKAYKPHWLLMAGAVVITGVAVFGISMLGGLFSLLFTNQPVLSAAVQFLMIIPQALVQGVLTLGLFNMSIKIARGQAPELGDLFAVWQRVGTWLAQSLVLGAIMLPLFIVFGVGAFMASQGVSAMVLGIAGGVFGLIALPVLFYVFLGFGFANVEIVAQPGVGAVAGLKNSWAIARGKRLELILIGLAIFGLYMVGAMACLIGAIFTMSYAAVLFAAYYLAVRNGTPQLSN
jgi:hypothetical protein